MNWMDKPNLSPSPSRTLSKSLKLLDKYHVIRNSHLKFNVHHISVKGFQTRVAVWSSGYSILLVISGCQSGEFQPQPKVHVVSFEQEIIPLLLSTDLFQNVKTMNSRYRIAFFHNGTHIKTTN